MKSELIVVFVSRYRQKDFIEALEKADYKEAPSFLRVPFDKMNLLVEVYIEQKLYRKQIVTAISPKADMTVSEFIDLFL